MKYCFNCRSKVLKKLQLSLFFAKAIFFHICMYLESKLKACLVMFFKTIFYFKKQKEHGQRVLFPFLKIRTKQPIFFFFNPFILLINFSGHIKNPNTIYI